MIKDYRSQSELILGIARDLCQRLNISPAPEILSWQARYFGSSGQPSPPLSNRFSKGGGNERPVSPDFPVIISNKVLLNPIMDGKLEPEEWAPLLASSLIFYRRLRGQNNRGALLRFSPMFLVLGLFLVLLAAGASSIVPLTPVEFVIFGVVVVPVTGIFSLFRVMQFSRSLGLLSDRKAADVVGRDQLLGVLRRLDAFRQQDVQEGRRKNWIGYGDLPSLGKRLENVQSMETYKTV